LAQRRENEMNILQEEIQMSNLKKYIANHKKVDSKFYYNKDYLIEVFKSVIFVSSDTL
jgi:hypothetical protein